MRILLGNTASASATDFDEYFKNVSLLLQADGSNGGANNTFIDSSANNYSLTTYNQSRQGSFSPFLGSYSMCFNNSTSDGLYVTNNANFALGTGNFTIECFVYSENKTDNSGRIFLQGQSGYSAISIDYDSSSINVTLMMNLKISYAWTHNIGQWYHIAVVRSGTGSNQLKLYIDGVNVASGTSTESITAYNVHVGGINWASDYNFRGFISNMRYSNVARTITVPTQNYVSDGNTLFLIGQKDSGFIDESSNANYVSVYGTPTVLAFSPISKSSPYSVLTHSGSMYFDGTGDSVVSTGNTGIGFGTGDYTVEFWAYPTLMTGSYGSCFGAGATGGFLFNFTGTSGQPPSGIAINSYGTGPHWSFGYAFSQQWYHIMVTRSGGTGRVFINGTLVSTSSDSPNYGSTSWAIGAAGQDTQPYSGYMSNVRVIKGTALQTSSFTKPTTPLSVVSGTSIFVKGENASIYDSSRNNVIQTQGNASLSTSVKKYGSASIYFDGNGDWLKIPNNHALNFTTGNFTIEFWVYYLSHTGYQTPYTKGYATSGGLLIQTYTGTGRLQVYVGSGGPQVAETSDPALNTWIHYAVVRNNGTVTIYKDGVSVASASASGSINNPHSAAIGANIFEGSGQADGTYPVHGYMDDFRITSGIARYTTNFTPPARAFAGNGL